MDSRVVCKYFLAGKCSFGARCKFSHDENMRPICQYYLQGRCIFKDKCPKLHKTSDQIILPPTFVLTHPVLCFKKIICHMFASFEPTISHYYTKDFLHLYSQKECDGNEFIISISSHAYNLHGRSWRETGKPIKDVYHVLRQQYYEMYHKYWLIIPELLPRELGCLIFSQYEIKPITQCTTCGGS